MAFRDYALFAPSMWPQYDDIRRQALIMLDGVALREAGTAMFLESWWFFTFQRI